MQNFGGQVRCIMGDEQVAYSLEKVRAWDGVVSNCTTGSTTNVEPAVSITAKLANELKLYSTHA